MSERWTKEDQERFELELRNKQYNHFHSEAERGENFFTKLLGCFGSILGGILAVVAIFFALWLVGTIIEALANFLPQEAKDILGIILGVALLVGMNIISYFASYVWGKRKPLFFWASISVTIAFLLLILMSV